MEMTSLAYSVVSAVIVGVGVLGGAAPRERQVITKNLPRVLEAQESATAKLVCKTGFKAGKTPVSLVVGAKVSCYNIAQAAAGKKLLTTDQTKTCFSCHSKLGITPATQMISNLRTQGYTLRASSIVTAFNAHVAEMAGATITTKNSKAISNYLQSIK